MTEKQGPEGEWVQWSEVQQYCNKHNILKFNRKIFLTLLGYNRKLNMNRTLPMLVGILLKTLNSWPRAIEWGRLVLPFLDFSDWHVFSGSVLCRESTELRLPEMFLWACLMDRKNRAEAWRIKPNLWFSFSASSSMHAPNKPEIEQTSDSIYVKCCSVKSLDVKLNEQNSIWFQLMPKKAACHAQLKTVTIILLHQYLEVLGDLRNFFMSLSAGPNHT